MEVLERAEELERAGRNMIHLEVGIPDFPTASHISEAAYEAIKAGETPAKRIGCRILQPEVQPQLKCRADHHHIRHKPGHVDAVHGPAG